MRQASSLLTLVLCGLSACGTDPQAPGAADPDGGAPPDDGGPVTPRCTGKAAAHPGTTMRTLQVSGGDRSYLLQVPAKYDPTRALPLVLAFHGFTDKDQAFADAIKLPPQSESRPFLMVAPQGKGVLPSWNAGACCGEAQIGKVDDVGFVAALISGLKQEFCVDETRVYAMGFSNGAFFSHRLACELADQLAAIGAVSGGLVSSPCQPKRPMPVLYFHGDKDTVVTYTGNTLEGFKGAVDTWQGWAGRDGCKGQPQQTLKQGSVTCQTYGPCDGGSEDTLCTIAGGAHAWPGTDGTKDIDATTAILDFFARFTRQPSP